MGIFRDFLDRVYHTPGTYDISEYRLTHDKKIQLDCQAYAIATGANLIAGLAAGADFQTLRRYTRIRESEWYLWNYRPNSYESAQQFKTDLIRRLLLDGEACVIEINGQLHVCSNFNLENKFFLFQGEVSDISLSMPSGQDLQIDGSYGTDHVLYFRLTDPALHGLLRQTATAYADLAAIAASKYEKCGGRKGVVSIQATQSGTDEQKAERDKKLSQMFKSYFSSADGVVVLPRGIDYRETTSPTNSATVNDITNIKNLQQEAFSRVAEALRIPVGLLTGDSADPSHMIDSALTTCIDPILDIIENEVCLKRYSMQELAEGTRLRIDRTCLKHVSPFDVANSADKLLADGIYNRDEIREKLGEVPLKTKKSSAYYMTKNYEEVSDE